MTMIGTLKSAVRPIIPLAIRIKRRDDRRRERLTLVMGSVKEAMDKISSLTPTQCTDARFIEYELIPALGLNNELTIHQPPELAHLFGMGLHIWQYPNQLADYLVWVAGNCSGIKSYMEIGCRWGGMLILTSEWLRKNGADLKSITAIDPIEPSPLIKTYFHLLQDVETTYIRELSTSAKAKEAVDQVKPDYVFIDGDHSLRGVILDHMLVRDHAKIIAHHDISSPNICPDTTFFWDTMKELESSAFESSEFVDQYASVPGRNLGIGTLKRKIGPARRDGQTGR
jgi:hypothetical protein